jgi:hypothetical protein
MLDKFSRAVSLVGGCLIEARSDPSLTKKAMGILSEGCQALMAKFAITKRGTIAGAEGAG